MTKIDDGGPAFPVIPPCDESGISEPGYPYPAQGMSLRDWFAGQAIALFPMSEKNVEALLVGAKPRHDIVASFCYDLADAMLEARKK